ncbi:MAG: hypothetical protein ACK5RL_06560 [Acidimicrobiales bacterium]
MASHGGGASADLRAILEAHCPDIADDVLAAYEVARSLADGTPRPPSTSSTTDQAGQLRWARLTLGQIAGLDQVLDLAAAPLEAVAAVLEVVAGLLDVLTAFLLELPDPIRAMILAAHQILKDLIDDLLSSGLYLYADVPGLTSWRKTIADAGDPESWKAGDPVAPPTFVGAFDGWADTFRQSFDDPGDQNRPIFSEGATVEAAFILATAPGMPEITPTLRILSALVDLGGIRQALDGADLPGFGDLGLDDPDDWRVRGTPTGPNWKAWRIADIAPPDYPLRELERIPAVLKALLLNVDGVIALLKDLIAAVRAKIDVLLELVEMIQRIIEMIKALSGAGLHVLVVTTYDGVDGLVEAFLAAGNRPGHDEDGVELPGLVIGGCCMLSGTATAVEVGASHVWEFLGLHGAFDEARAALQADIDGHAETFAAQGGELVAAYRTMKEQARETVEDYEADRIELEAALQEAREELAAASGLPLSSIGAALEDFRDDLYQQLEESGGVTRMAVDPLVAAEIEGARAARQRGRRSLANRATEGP